MVIGGGKHAARSAGLVQDGNDLAVVKNIVATFGGQDGDHHFDDIAPGIKLTGIDILVKAADQIFKDVTHLNRVKFLFGKVEFGESFHHIEQAIFFVHLVDVVFDIEFVQDILHIRGEAAYVRLEVRGKVIGIVAKFV